MHNQAKVVNMCFIYIYTVCGLNCCSSSWFTGFWVSHRPVYYLHEETISVENMVHVCKLQHATWRTSAEPNFNFSHHQSEFILNFENKEICCVCWNIFGLWTVYEIKHLDICKWHFLWRVKCLQYFSAYMESVFNSLCFDASYKIKCANREIQSHIVSLCSYFTTRFD